MKKRHSVFILFAVFLFFDLCLGCTAAFGAILSRGKQHLDLEARYDSCHQMIKSGAIGDLSDYIRYAYTELEIGNQLQNQEMIIQGYIDLSRTLYSMKKYDLALQNAHKALLLLQTNESDAQNADANKLTGAIYTALHEPDLAEKYLTEAHAFYYRTNDTTNLLKTMGELATVHGQRGEYERCISALSELYYLCSKHEKSYLQLIASLNMVLAYKLSGQVEKGLHALHRIDLEIPDSLAHEPKYRASYLQLRGELYAMQERYEDAGQDFRTSLRMVQASDNWEAQTELFKNLSLLCLKQKQYDSLPIWFNALLAAQDSLKTHANPNRISEKEFIYDITNKDKQLEKLELRIWQNRIIGLSITAIVILILGLIGYLYYQRAKTHKAKMAQWHKERKQDKDTMTDIAIYFHELKSVVGSVSQTLHEVGRTLSDNEKRKIQQCCLQLNDIVSENKALLNSFTDARYNDFIQRLSVSYPDLSDTEKRICAMLLVGFSSKDIANVLNCSDRSLNNSRSKIRKKLNIPEKESILQFLKSL